MNCWLPPPRLRRRGPLAVEAVGLLGVRTHGLAAIAGAMSRSRRPASMRASGVFAGDGAAVDAGPVHDVVRIGIAAATASAEQQAGEKRARPVYTVHLGSWC